MIQGVKQKNGRTLEMNPEAGLEKVSNMEKQLEQQTETESSMFDVKLRQGCGEFLTKVTKDAAAVDRVVLCVWRIAVIHCGSPQKSGDRLDEKQCILSVRETSRNLEQNL